MDKKYAVYEEKARKIFAKSGYMVVGTSTKKGKTWLAPVMFVHDDSFNLYFLSAIDALHSKNILENPYVSIAIFDSHQKIGYSEGGIQAEGKVTLVEKNNIENVITLYCKKAFPKSEIKPTKRYIPDNYLGDAEFRFFGIKLDNVYVTGEDRRVKVELTDR